MYACRFLPTWLASRAPARRSALLWWASLALLTLTHCQHSSGTELLRIDSVLPSEVQFGDSIQIQGDGFALGSPATVTLKGSVHRAGHASAPIDVSLRAQTESQTELSLELPRNVEPAFCGAPEEASHATFRGHVQVAIAAKAAGAPPVTGRLQGVVLELYPAVKTQVAEDRTSALGRRALEFFGMEVAEAAEGGLLVLSTAPGSRAVAADLRPGDRLVRAAGLTVMQPSDLVPEATRVLSVGVMRGSSEIALELSADGFAPTPPGYLRWAGLLLGVMALGFLGAASPAARVAAWLIQSATDWRRAGARVRSKGKTSAPSGAPGSSLMDLFGGSLGVLIWLFIGAALLAPVLRGASVDVSLGLLALMFGSSALLGAFGLIHGGRVGSRWSLLRGARAALVEWVIAAPGWLAVLAICSETGADFDDIVRGQGAYPWQWNAFANPGLLVLFVLLVSTALPRSGRPLWRLSQAKPTRLQRGRGENPLGRLYLCAMCAVAAVAFMGGGAWPVQNLGLGGAALVPAIVLLAKYTGLVLGVSLLRSISFGITSEQWAPLSLRVCLPLSLAAAGLAHGFRSLDAWSPFWRWVELGFGPLSVGVLVVLGAVTARRVFSPLGRPSTSPLSPWL
jgi:NADH-quinone oxidoreductase subunit H